MDRYNMLFSRGLWIIGYDFLLSDNNSLVNIRLINTNAFYLTYIVCFCYTIAKVWGNAIYFIQTLTSIGYFLMVFLFV